MCLADIDVLLNDPGVSDQARQKLGKAQDDLNKALAELAQGDVKQALKEISDAVKDLLKATDEGVDVATCNARLIEAAHVQAQDAINAAISAGGKQNDIDKAQVEMDKALEELETGKPDKAIDHFAKAWGYAQNANN